MSILDKERGDAERVIAKIARLAGETYEFAYNRGQYVVFAVTSDFGPIFYGVHRRNGRLVSGKALRNA